MVVRATPSCKRHQGGRRGVYGIVHCALVRLCAILYVSECVRAPHFTSCWGAPGSAIACSAARSEIAGATWPSRRRREGGGHMVHMEHLERDIAICGWLAPLPSTGELIDLCVFMCGFVTKCVLLLRLDQSMRERRETSEQAWSKARHQQHATAMTMVYAKPRSKTPA